MGQSIKLADDIVKDVRFEAKLLRRSVAKQAEHWLRIGQAIEQSPSFDYTRIKAALAGKFDADNLSIEEGVIFDEKIFSALEETSDAERVFFEKRQKAGLGVGEDEEGNLIYK
ncbi:ParD-like family protein [Paremcibacter congregatus]|uniref:ParD-like antitoxin of type II toxin-antitoxin system n=1 Tax=Paremcibacter congregatus TaxID=2043170 RepID=A0A2G4YNP9_9PROT|nr:ParD-like family protein [Paremcibacter congregatus]PHZ83927.1 hypothetical protein CRD36_16070 [Paremcibacter congregatus]QDE27569.1 hypothetical protein FIV45_09900 [Paremcibacter congregatus]